jgi:hypothetical protein
MFFYYLESKFKFFLNKLAISDRKTKTFVQFYHLSRRYENPSAQVRKVGNAADFHTNPLYLGSLPGRKSTFKLISLLTNGDKSLVQNF